METTRSQRFTEVIEYLLKAKKAYNQVDLGEKLGVTKSRISDLKNGTKPLSDKMIELIVREFPEISSSWLMTGEGEMLRVESAPPPRGEDTVELPLIPISAMAGALSGDGRSFMEYDCEKYVVPAFEGADFLIRVQGDSMTPTYESGDIVACQRVPLDRLWFQWGKAYVIDTRQGALVKRIEPSEAEGCISIRSDNPRYKPFDLPTEEVNGVALVKGLIRVE